jgi:hypothetical protein
MKMSISKMADLEHEGGPAAESPAIEERKRRVRLIDNRHRLVEETFPLAHQDSP